MKKHVLAIILAATLLTGCTTTGGDSQKDAPTPNAIGLCLTDEEADNANFGFAPYPDMFTTTNLITETENGYYYLIAGSTHSVKYDGFIAQESSPILMYADKETGIQTAVCPKPECTHDGNLFCTASTRAYRHGAITYADGKLFAIATKIPDPDHPTANTSDVVMRYELDGSAIEDMANLGETRGSCTPPLAHRGYLWFLMRKDNGVINPETDTVCGIGWEIMGYELATGKLVTLFSTIPEGYDVVSYNEPQRLYADGDYLYFNIDTTGGKVSPDTKSGLISVSLQTGEAKQVLEKNVGFVENGCTFYPTNGVSEEMFIVNLETGEKTSLGKNTKSDRFIATKDYIMCINYRTDTTVPNGGNYLYRFFRYDGSLAGEVAMPWNWYVSNAAVKDGNIYFYRSEREEDRPNSLTKYHDYVCYTDIEEFIKGNTDMKIAYTNDYTVETTFY